MRAGFLDRLPVCVEVAIPWMRIWMPEIVVVMDQDHVRIEPADQEPGMGQPVFVGRAIRQGQDMDPVHPGEFIDLVGQITDIEHGFVGTVEPEMVAEAIVSQVAQEKLMRRRHGREGEMAVGADGRRANEPEIDSFGSDLVGGHLDIPNEDALAFGALQCMEL